MILENQEVSSTPDNAGVEGSEQDEKVTLSKSEYEKLNQTLGSLKRELKDKRKAEESQETTEKTNKDDSVLLNKLEKFALKSAGITHEDDIELARKTAKKWGMDLDEVVDDEDFKSKLERQQTARQNEEATTGVRGDKGSSSQVKLTPEYWIAKGTPPSADQVPDRKVRAQIARAMIASARTSGKKFYND